MEARVARCHLLAEVLSADGMMTDGERSVLEGAMERHGLSDAERDLVRHFEQADGAIPALLALPEDQRREILDDLVDAALADGKLTANETAAVKRIAASLGLE